MPVPHPRIRPAQRPGRPASIAPLTPGGIPHGVVRPYPAPSGRTGAAAPVAASRSAPWLHRRVGDRAGRRPAPPPATPTSSRTGAPARPRRPSWSRPRIESIMKQLGQQLGGDLAVGRRHLRRGDRSLSKDSAEVATALAGEWDTTTDGARPGRLGARLERLGAQGLGRRRRRTDHAGPAAQPGPDADRHRHAEAAGRGGRHDHRAADLAADHRQAQRAGRLERVQPRRVGPVQGRACPTRRRRRPACSR